MKKLPLAIAAALAVSLAGCKSGTTLKELAEMSEIERQQLTEIYLEVELPEDAELKFWETFSGCTNLTKVEISPDFKGEISSGRCYNGPKHLKTFIAKGATKLGYSVFYAGADDGYNEDLEVFEMPGIRTMDLHSLGGYRATNQIRILDFPNLMGIGSQLAGCGNLTTLKLGYDGPISFYQGFASSIDTENIDLYLGKYEYENNVKGNLLYPHAYPDKDKGDFSLNGNPDTDDPFPTGDPVRFRSIQPYK